MTNRDRWRVYKRVSVMFFLAVVALTVMQRGNVGTGPPFQIERQTRGQEPSLILGLGGGVGGGGVLGGDREAASAAASTSSQERRKHPPSTFWKTSKPQQPPAGMVEETTEAPPPVTRDGEDSGSGVGTHTWDVTSSNCTANLNLTREGWFAGLEANFKQFLLYRHCRYFPMLMNHPEKCAVGSDGSPPRLLLVVKSVATQHDRRETIRRTWGRERTLDGPGGGSVRTLFLLGTPSSAEAERPHHQKLLEYEDRLYGDILQWDFLDTFFNLTLKETHFLKWFAAYCPGVRHVFKGDDDVFVSIDNILEFLEMSENSGGGVGRPQPPPPADLFVGDVLFKAKPIRKKDNKYYVPQALYNKTHYPPYAGGGGFLMSGPLARRLHAAADTLELYPIDDVFLGMCLEVLGVAPVKHNAFKTFGLVKDKRSKLNREPCFFRSMIVVHKLLPPDLERMWDLVGSSDLVCAQKKEILL